MATEHLIGELTADAPSPIRIPRGPGLGLPGFCRAKMHLALADAGVRD